MWKRIIALVAVFGALGSLMLGGAQAQGCSGSTPWQAAYFANPDWTGTPAVTQCEAVPNYNNITAAPVAGLPQTGWSVRWTGIFPFAGGVVNFAMTSDELARIYLDGVPILQFGGGGSINGNYTVPAGNHTVVVEFRNTSGAAFFGVTWSGIPGGVPTATPVGFIPSATPITGATAGPSPTPGPTFTPTRTPLPPIPGGAITATVARANVVNGRQGPSLQAPILTRVYRGQTYQIVGRDARTRWFLLQGTGFQFWVFGYYLVFYGNEFNVPVVSGAGSRTPINVDMNRAAIGVTEGGMRLRAEPNTTSAQIGRIPWGEQIPIIGRTADGQWYQTVWFGTTGYVYSPFVRITEGNIDNVPIIR
jgi:uncharacterized protein YgiM (DUF1202 family)